MKAAAFGAGVLRLHKLHGPNTDNTRVKRWGLTPTDYGMQGSNTAEDQI